MTLDKKNNGIQEKSRHGQRSVFDKDETIDTRIIRKYNIPLEPFVFMLYFNRDHSFSKITDQTRLRHNHRNFELHCFLEGNGTFEVGESILEILPDSFCLIGPKVYHVPHEEEDNPVLKYTFQFDYRVSKKNAALLKEPWCAAIMQALADMEFKYIKGGSKIPSLIESMKTEFENRPPLFDHRIKNILSEIMIEILRSIIKEQGMEPDKKTDEDMRDLKIEIFFDENYWRPELTAEQMASAIGISARHLNRLIEKNFSLTFRQKLIQTRIESAKGFLVSTDSTVACISENVGFNTAEYFYKSFKQETGVTPGEYRKMNKSDR